MDATMAPKEAAARFYFQLTLGLSQQDLTKMSQINSLPVYLVLNTASIIKDERIREQNEMKQLNEKTRKRI